MSYVIDGQRVYVPWRGRWVLAMVQTAMGRTARVVNELLGLDTWADVDELREAP